MSRIVLINDYDVDDVTLLSETIEDLPELVEEIFSHAMPGDERFDILKSVLNSSRGYSVVNYTLKDTNQSMLGLWISQFYSLKNRSTHITEEQIQYFIDKNADFRVGTPSVIKQIISLDNSYFQNGLETKIKILKLVAERFKLRPEEYSLLFSPRPYLRCSKEIIALINFYDYLKEHKLIDTSVVVFTDYGLTIEETMDDYKEECKMRACTNSKEICVIDNIIQKYYDRIDYLTSNDVSNLTVHLINTDPTLISVSNSLNKFINNNDILDHNWLIILELSVKKCIRLIKELYTAVAGDNQITIGMSWDTNDNLFCDDSLLDDNQNSISNIVRKIFVFNLFGLTQADLRKFYASYVKYVYDAVKYLSEKPRSQEEFRIVLRSIRLKKYILCILYGAMPCSIDTTALQKIYNGIALNSDEYVRVLKLAIHPTLTF